ncbi:MAG: cell division protein ZapD [Gammaproteobacteria bacterium]|nr:cell division protein ZapD [Gammaproteobacteria bacterium]
MSEAIIAYEQPVNEHIRVCLRLERLFSQIGHTLKGVSPWDSRAAVVSLLEILYLLDRPDLKAKLTKEICRHITNFSKLEQQPNIDVSKLKHLLTQLESINERLHLTQGKFAQELRQNEMLNSIRQYSLNPGGACAFEVPSYHYWLHKPSQERIQDLTNWVKKFDTIKEAIELLLRLIRDCGQPQEQQAEQGFFQTMLDPQLPCQLVQVFVDAKQDVYPEISVGRHGIFIRFLNPNFYDKPAQTKKSLTFKMTCCIL